MAALDELTNAGKRIIEAPIEMINEGLGLVGDGVNGALQETSNFISTATEGVQKAVDDGMKGVQAVVNRPLQDFSKRVSTLGSKLRT